MLAAGPRAPVVLGGVHASRRGKMPAAHRMVWRICSRRHIAQAYDGEGARIFGGRWNHPGTRVVYTAATVSLAALELFVNLDPDVCPDDLVAIPAEIPRAVKVMRVELSDLPGGWRRYPTPVQLQDIGSAWVADRATAVLAVPSAVVPQERNYLINPAHPDFRRIRIGKPEPFRFDIRMWKSRR